MKKLSLLLFAVIFVFAGCSKSDDILLDDNDNHQLKSADKGAGYTEQFYFYPGPVYDEDGNLLGNDYWLPVICDGTEIDYLLGDGESLKVHVIIHYKNGEMVWGKYLVSGSLTSENTGETFAIHEANKFQFGADGLPYLLTHTNAIGDRGTHYVFSAKFIYEDGSWEDVKAMCVPD